jgi:2-polyprenyl-6-methoxyphenol hydroxylase-like FAD-dependent oxidoreductase
VSSERGGRAVVLGAGLAGLLAARALTHTHDQVKILERDVMSDGGVRPGVPQGRHVHVLLASGHDVIDQLCPGVVSALVESGAPLGDPLADATVHLGGSRFIETVSGLPMLCASRPHLEAHVADHVASQPGVDLARGVAVTGLDGDASQPAVTGVRLGDGSTIDADLVVDATGRRTRSPEWLTDLGIGAPPEERAGVRIAYATRRYQLTPGTLGGRLASLCGPTPERPRGGAVTRVEGDICLLTVFGVGDERPPTDPDGFDAFAASLEIDEATQVLSKGTPLDEPVGHRFDRNLRRRWERMDRVPEGFVAVGDSVCSLNPIYGQGMSVAALSALTLRRHAHGPARRRARAIASVTSEPWEMAVGADLSLPGADRPPDRRQRFLASHVARVHRAAATNPRAGIGFMRVAGMVDPARSLMRPRLLVAALTGR